MASAYAFKDGIKKISGDRKYDFKIKLNSSEQILRVSLVSTAFLSGEIKSTAFWRKALISASFFSLNVSVERMKWIINYKTATNTC